MRRIDLTPYPVKVNEKGELVDFDVKGSISASLYHPDLRLSARELLENHEVAKKIKVSTAFVLLEEADYDKVKHAFEVLRGFDENDVELVKRVFDAPKVEVEVKDVK